MNFLCFQSRRTSRRIHPIPFDEHEQTEYEKYREYPAEFKELMIKLVIERNAARQLLGDFQKRNVELLEKVRTESIVLKNEILSRQRLDSIAELSLDDSAVQK